MAIGAGPRTLLLALAATGLIVSGGVLAAAGGTDAEPTNSSRMSSGAPDGASAPLPEVAAAAAREGRWDGSEELAVVPVAIGPQRPAAASPGALATAGDPRTPRPAPATPAPESPDAAEGAAGEVHIWQDGEHTRRVVLQPGLAVRAGGEITPKDEVLARSSAGALVEGGGGGPVFRADGGGGLMTLPGGVVLVLDPGWDEEAVAAFLGRNAISEERVAELGWLPNGFFVETKPGFPSLELANALAGQEGVLLAAPNWWREVEPQ